MTKTSGTIYYTYDASGNRISKTFNGNTAWYVRDATGNVMAVYEKRSDLNSNHLTQSEAHLYGSSRLGIYTVNRDMENPPTGEITIFERGRKFFELTNHLGNVLATISDRKTGVDNNTDGQIDYYTADVVSATDNYVFGMTMPGRNYQNDKYRYGFNGKEKDKDINEGDLDFGARIYDARVARWLAVDRDASNYPSITPYAFAINSPLRFIDPNGKWVVEVVKNSANNKYELKFVAEKDDNLEILAIQLGLPKETLLKADPTLDKLHVTTGVSIDLQNLDIVQSINKSINAITDEWNCANFAYNASSGKKLDVQFDENNWNNNLDDMDTKLKNKYASVPVDGAQIGSVLRYDYITGAENTITGPEALPHL